MTSPAARADAAVVKLLDDVLMRLRAHGFVAHRIEIPGALTVDLGPAADEPATGVLGSAAASESRGLRTLRIQQPQGE